MLRSLISIGFFPTKLGFGRASDLAKITTAQIFAPKLPVPSESLSSKRLSPGPDEGKTSAGRVGFLH